MILRFDDITKYTDLDEIHEMVSPLLSKGVKIMFCISPFVAGDDKDRVFPAIWKAYSDPCKFFEVEDMGIPDTPYYAKIASHGLIHIDHRLLHTGAQAMSIVASCSLLNCKTFVPPFNKWNHITEQICASYDIELIKFEDGWLSCEHNKFDPEHEKWYLHHRNFTQEKWNQWLGR